MPKPGSAVIRKLMAPVAVEAPDALMESEEAALAPSSKAMPTGPVAEPRAKVERGPCGAAEPETREKTAPAAVEGLTVSGVPARMEPVRMRVPSLTVVPPE